MVLSPIVVDRRFHIFMNSIPYPKGSLNVLIAHFGTFYCKCGIRTEINSLFNKRGSKRRKSNSHSCREFLRFFYAHFQNKLFAYLEKHVLVFHRAHTAIFAKTRLPGVVGSRGKIAKLLWREYVEVSEQTNRGNGCRPPYGTPSFAFAGNPFP